MAGQEVEQLPAHRIIKLKWDAHRGYHNESVQDFDGLVPHHPNSNKGAHLVNGAVEGGQPGRT
ncbi:MAG: hypothetical protein ACOH1V_06675 [Stenotrophomonas sp.]